MAIDRGEEGYLLRPYTQGIDGRNARDKYFQRKGGLKPPPTNIEMWKFVNEVHRRNAKLCESVGCCGGRDEDGNCSLTGFRCRVVAAAEMALKRGGVR